MRGATDAGARVAEPGEFTLRAYLNGRMDLVRAEAVADLIAAVTPAQARAASDQLNGTLTTAIGQVEQRLFDVLARLEASLDFPEEGYHFIPHDEVLAALAEARGELAGLVASSRAGRVLREGRTLAIVGRPNAGKSSLFNALLGGDRAIVSDEPGTTRDLVSERCDVHGIPLVLVDTAGWRRTRSAVEAEGVRRAEGAARAADVVVVVVDGSAPLSAADRALLAVRGSARVVAVNKADQGAAWDLSLLKDARSDAVRVSALTGDGLDELRSRLVSVLVGDERALDDVRVTNVRHATLLERAQASWRRPRTWAPRTATRNWWSRTCGRPSTRFRRSPGSGPPTRCCRRSFPVLHRQVTPARQEQCTPSTSSWSARGMRAVKPRTRRRAWAAGSGS